MDAADDRREVMFAMRFKTNVAQDHDLVVAADLLEGALEIIPRIVVIAGKPFLIGAHDTRRRGSQAFAVRVVARPLNECTRGSLGLGPRRPVGPVFFGGLRPSAF